jgi:exonuclease III
MLNICTQNFNGIMGENQMEEAYLQMKKLDIGILCGQEGRRPSQAITRWDTEELMITFESDNIMGNTSMKKDGNFFILSATWKDAFLKGGKQMMRYCPRLVTIRLPLGPSTNLYLINYHYPDSGKTLAIRQSFQERLDRAVSATRPGDVLVLAGDANACTGTSRNFDDGVCGSHGHLYLNEAGRRFRGFAAYNELVDLLTWERQKMTTSFHDYRTGHDKQLDRILVPRAQKFMVSSCQTIPMIVNSDHEAVLLRMSFSKPPSTKPTARQQMTRRDIAESFTACTHSSVVHDIRSTYNNNKGTVCECSRLTTATKKAKYKWMV